MLHHTMLGTNDVGRARRSCDAVPGLRGASAHMGYVRDPDGNQLCAIDWVPVEARS